MKRMYNAPFGTIHYNQTDPYETAMLQAHTTPIQQLLFDFGYHFARVCVFV